MKKKETITQKCIENLDLMFQMLGDVSKVKFVRDSSKLIIQSDRETIELQVDIKAVLKRPLPEHLVAQNKINKTPSLLMAEYINSSIANDFVKNRINYIDCQGNAYIHSKGKVLIHIQGKTRVKELEKEATALFQPKGMRVLFVLLTNEGMVNSTIRDLARQSAVSTGRTVSIIKELKGKGYIRETAKNQLKLTRKKDLLENWLSNYGDRMRPGLVLGSYKMAISVENDLEEILTKVFQGKENQYAVSGSLGADRLLHYYRGKTTEIFVVPEMTDLIRKELKLMPSREPNITLLNLFSPEVIFYQGDAAVAHPLFIYAELLYRGGDRERKTAGMIYDQYLQELFE